MTYPLVKFVDAAAVSANVRLDLNDGTASASRRVEKDFDLGVPELNGDPLGTGQQYGPRNLLFTVQVKGTKANALAFVSALSKELNRRANWVMFQLSATTSPVWFRTYRTQSAPISLEGVYGNTTTGGASSLPDYWRVEVPLTADPFAYGARVTIPQVQLIQSPADLTGPTRYAMRYVLPAIKGDAPTELRVEIAPQTSPNSTGSSSSAWMVGCISGTSSMSDPVIDIGTGDGFTGVNGAASGTSDAASFGGSRRVVTIAAATPNLTTRLLATMPVVPIGRYKVLLRCQAASGGVEKTLLFRLNRVYSITTVGKYTASVALGATDAARLFWVDLGDASFPNGVTVPADVSVTPRAGGFNIDIGTADGSAATVNIDAIKLIPVDGPTVSNATLLRSTGPTYQPLVGPIVGTFDGDIETYWSYNTTDSRLNEGNPVLSGSYPVADPAAERNLLVVMAMDNGRAHTSTPYITSLDTQAGVTVSYHPRYLYLGDGS